ncbi:MAG: Bax inhibitor-1/YccA family membrane protein [Micromonosporaceae bacterium]
MLAALTFVLDFDMVEQGARYGLERRFAWYCAFGIVVGLVFLYVQLLQLLSLLRE